MMNGGQCICSVVYICMVALVKQNYFKIKKTVVCIDKLINRKCRRCAKNKYVN